MSELEDIDQKIAEIRQSEEYRRLLVTHRGKMEEDRLYMLNLRIAGYETQKKLACGGNPPAQPTHNTIRSGTLKPSLNKAPAKYMVPKTLSGSVSTEAESSEVRDYIAPKLPAALRRAMPAPPAAAPPVRTSGPISTISTRGSPLGKGSIKATRPAGSSSLVPAASKSARTIQEKSEEKTQTVPEPKTIPEDEEDLFLDSMDLGITYTEDNINLDELDLESVESEDL